MPSELGKKRGGEPTGPMFGEKPLEIQAAEQRAEEAADAFFKAGKERLVQMARDIEGAEFDQERFDKWWAEAKNQIGTGDPGNSRLISCSLSLRDVEDGVVSLDKK